MDGMKGGSILMPPGGGSCRAGRVEELESRVSLCPSKKLGEGQATEKTLVHRAEQSRAASRKMAMVARSLFEEDVEQASRSVKSGGRSVEPDWIDC